MVKGTVQRPEWTTLCLLLTLSMFVARAQSNTGSIVGRAVDTSGKAVAGAAITIKNTDLSSIRTVIADQTGDFRVSGLVPGALIVEGSAQGLTTRRPVRVTLGLGSTVRVTLPMSIPIVRQKATVTANGRTSEGNTVTPAVNREEASVSSFFAGLTVTYLPNRDRDFTQFAQLGAGETQDADGSGLIVAGQRSVSVMTQVDGVRFNDPLQGGRRGGGDDTFFLPQTVVREFQIVRSGVTAEVGGTNAGLVNVATKEGSNRVRGEAFVTSRPAWATSADAFGHRLQNRQNTFGASYGGPIRPGKVFYYAGAEQDLLQAPAFVQFEPQGAGVVVPAWLASQETEIRQKSSPGAVFVRLDDVLSERHTLNLVVAMNRIRGSNVGNDSSRSVATVDHTDHLTGQSIWLKGSVATLFGSNRLNQLLVSWTGDHRSRTPNSFAPEQVVNGFGTLGGDGLGTHRYTSNQLQGADSFSLTRGRSVLDAGGTFAYSPAYEEHEANLNGRFDYNSLADYLASRPRRYQQTFATGNTRYDGSIRSVELFVNGKFPLTTNLMATGGVRWSGQWNPQPPGQNQGSVAAQTIPSDLTQWQPRLGLAWSPLSRTVVRLSSGIYDAPTPATIFRRVAVDNGLQTVTVDSYFDPQVLALIGEASHSFPTIPSGLATLRSLVYGIAPSFRNPRSFQFAGSVEQEVTPSLKLMADYLHGSTWRLPRRVDENLNRPNMIVAGLPVFPSRRINPAVGRLIVNQSTAHSDYNGLLLSSTYQVGPRSQLSVSYTFSQTHDDDSTHDGDSIDSALSPYDLSLERAFSSEDVRHVLKLNGIFNLPFGFKLNPLLLASSGRPYTPIIGFDTQNDANDWNDRALIAGATAGRNSMRQPASSNVDVRVVKDFTLRGVGRHLDLFLDGFNLMGTRNLSFGPQAVSLYGDSKSPVASQQQPLFAPNGTRFGGPREFQFTARLVGF